MNKGFLKHLNERRNSFKLLDLSVDDEEANKKSSPEEEDQVEDSGEGSDEAPDEDFIPKTKYNAREFTKYLQYITASD